MYKKPKGMNKIKQAVKLYKNSIIVVNKYSNEIEYIMPSKSFNKELNMNIYMYYKVGA